MNITLPRLTHDLDCEPLGYPGLVVTLWVNPTYDDHVDPWDEETDPDKRRKLRLEILDEEPWRSEYWYLMGRIIEAVTFPPEMVGKEEPVRIETPDAKALYDLAFTPGFDQEIIRWAGDMSGQHRREWRDDARKN